jgi:8-oxo-dGTP pyrophosphatase MutT (NUDIX family)
VSDSQPLYRGKVVNVYRDEVQLPNGHRETLEIVRHPGGASAVAIDAEGRVCLLRQYRHSVGAWIWELPAGRLEPDEPPDVTAVRELEEEAGYRADRWQSLGRILSSPGVFDEIIHLYLAQELTAVGTRQEPGELIEIHWIAFASAMQMIASGEIEDAKTIAGLHRAQMLLAPIR